MKDLQWFPRIAMSPRAAERSLLWPAVLGGMAGLLFVMRGHPLLALAIWGTELLLVLACLNRALRATIRRAMYGYAHGAVQFLAMRILWLFYVVVVGTIHFVLAAARADVLGLEPDNDKNSYWQAAAPERERAKYYERLFTLEPPCQESHLLARTAGILVLGLLLGVSGEFILRSMGFGSPIVYRVDPRIRYYPAPNQDVHRYGGRVHINAFGMRSRDIAAAKPAGTFRILMLGDSTLYGGSYVDQSQTYASRLEELMNKNLGVLPGPSRKVEVLSMGVNGWGPQHELAYVKEFGLFSADVVMVMGPPADAYRAIHGIEQMPFFVEGNRPLLAWEELLDHIFWEYHLRLTGGGASFEDSPSSQEVIQDGIAAWLAIASLARAQGARIDFEFLPQEEEVWEGRAGGSTQRVLNALTPELGKREIPFSYPLTLFRSALQVRKVYHDGAHLDSSGHALYAAYLRDRVVKVATAK